MLQEVGNLIYLESDADVTYPLFRKVMGDFFLSLNLRHMLDYRYSYMPGYIVGSNGSTIVSTVESPYERHVIKVNEAVSKASETGNVYLGGYPLHPTISDIAFVKESIEIAKPKPSFYVNANVNKHLYIKDLKGMNDLLVTLLMEEAFLNTEP